MEDTETQADRNDIDDVSPAEKSTDVIHPHDNVFPITSPDGHIPRENARAESISTGAEDVEALGNKTASVITAEQYPPPSKEEATRLRKVADSIPTSAYLLCIVEFAERASYYGAKTVWSNYMQFPLPEGGNGAGAPAPGTEDTAGALDRGIQFSVAIGLLFS